MDDRDDFSERFEAFREEKLGGFAFVHENVSNRHSTYCVEC